MRQIHRKYSIYCIYWRIFNGNKVCW